MRFFNGQRIRITSTFSRIDGTLYNPTTLEFRISLPDGTTVTYTKLSPETVNPSVGVWYVEYTLTQVGEYVIVTASTTATEEAVDQDWIYVS